MNYYFLLEDEKSLLKVLPHWLDHRFILITVITISN